MPELPEVQALAERLDAALAGTVLARCEQLGFSALASVVPSPDVLVGTTVSGVRRRGKYAVIELADGSRVAFHLSQGGRVDLEVPPKATRPRGAVARFVFERPGETDRSVAVLVREHGTRRKARWWVLAPGDEGPLATLGPEPDTDELADLVLHGDSTRRLHTWLRDQHVVAGLGRGHTDDVLHRACLSPFASLGGLGDDQRRRLLDAVRSVLAEALAGERQRTGGLSEARLGDRFVVHGRAGQPCPRCGETLLRVSYDDYELTYCKACQTAGRALADRRLSRLLR